MTSGSRKIVIVGGGVHGASIAYYLSKRNIPCTIIESVEIGAAASGKSGGFLAREWGSGVTVPLHQISFDMHRDLAIEFNLKTYRQITTLSVDGSLNGPVDARWLNRKVKSSLMDTQTAQVTSMELTSKFMEYAQTAGATYIHGTVDGIDIQNAIVRGVSVTGQGIIEADQVVLAMGPWTGALAEDWLGITLPMDGIKSTSIVFSGCDTLQGEPFACFCEEDCNGCHLELYPRPNGDLYVCGIGGSEHISGDELRPGGEFANATAVMGDTARVDAACASLNQMSSIVDGREPDVVQACMRPCTPDGLPVMGNVPGIEGAFISTGHNCWGILWAPVCGLCMSELLIDGKATTVDLSPFNLARFLSRSQRER